MYPSLTNFSIHSTRIIRPGFKFARTSYNTLKVHEFTEYRDYIMSLAKKIHKDDGGVFDFDRAVDLILSFNVNGSKDHYEILARKMELESLFQTGEVHIAPISIDGSCNVFQHLSALTRDEVIAPLVKTSHQRGIDIYKWFENMLVKEIEWDQVRAFLHALPEFNMSELIKPPIMTFPYGSTLYNIQKYLKQFLSSLIGNVE